MSKTILGILVVLLPILAFAQSPSSASSYQPATITSVKLHEPAKNPVPADALYEVSVRAGRAVYVVLTPSPSPAGTILYSVGREILIHIGDSTITWNDIMGQSHEVPIISKTPVADASGNQN